MDTKKFFRKLGGEAFSLIKDIEDPLRVVGTNPLGQETMKVDMAIEDLAIERLKEKKIGRRLVTEERGEVELEGKNGVVILDPLDGSNNYRRHVPFYGMIVGFAKGDKYDDITHSYAINLSTGDEYWAVKGGGAFANGKRMKTSSETDLMKCILEYDPNYNQKIYDRIMPLLKNVKDVRRFGANALSLCYIASGAHHLFIDLENGLSVIHAPGLKIAEEAGAIVTNPQGNPINPPLRVDATLSFVCSANKVVHKKALELVK